MPKVRRITKNILVENLDNGKLYPKQGLPGGSGILSEADKSKVVFTEDVNREKQIKTSAKMIFLTFRLPDDLKDKLTQISKDLTKEYKAKAEDVDHVTLFYVPSDKPISKEVAQKIFDAIKAGVSNIGAMKAQIQGWIQFDNADNTVLAVAINSTELADLHVAIKDSIEEAGLDPKQIHGFIPHATVAYLPRGTRVEELPVLEDKFVIDKIEFVHSDITEIILAKRNVIKKLSLNPDSDPEVMSVTELREAHSALHIMYEKEKESKANKFSTENIVSLHTLVVDELLGRNKPHPPPPNSELDDVSKRCTRKKSVDSASNEMDVEVVDREKAYSDITVECWEESDVSVNQASKD